MGDREKAASCNIGYLSRFVEHVGKVERHWLRRLNGAKPTLGPTYPILDNPEGVSHWEKCCMSPYSQKACGPSRGTGWNTTSSSSLSSPRVCRSSWKSMWSTTAYPGPGRTSCARRFATSAWMRRSGGSGACSSVSSGTIRSGACGSSWSGWIWFVGGGCNPQRARQREEHGSPEHYWIGEVGVAHNGSDLTVRANKPHPRSVSMPSMSVSSVGFRGTRKQRRKVFPHIPC